MPRNHADQRDGIGKRKITAVRKSASVSPTADDLISQARHARSPSAEQGIDSPDDQAYGVARTHKGPFDNATAFSAPTYEHDLPTRQQLEAAQRSRPRNAANPMRSSSKRQTAKKANPAFAPRRRS